MSKLCTIASSSSGNSYFYSAGGTSLLIDIGISCKRVTAYLKSVDIEPGSLSGILITHEHIDHVNGIMTFLKNYDVPVYASRETLEYLICAGKIKAERRLFAVEDTFCINNLEITPFDTPHDCAHSLGYIIKSPDLRKTGIVTDLGYVTDTVREHLTGCDLVLLESNYDTGMLECSRYPYYLKRRIKSNTGHLSNDACGDEIIRLIKSGTTYFILAHLSRENNMPQIAENSAVSMLKNENLAENKDYILKVAPAVCAGEMIVF